MFSLIFKKTKFFPIFSKDDKGNDDYLISGWIISFFPFLKDGKKNAFCWDCKTWKLTRELDDFDMTKYMGLSIHEFNHHLNIVPFSWKYYGVRHNMLLVGGLVGVHLNTDDSSSIPTFGYGIIGPDKNANSSDEEVEEKTSTHQNNSLYDSIEYDENKDKLEKLSLNDSYSARAREYEKLEEDPEEIQGLSMISQDLELENDLQESIVTEVVTNSNFQIPINEFEEKVETVFRDNVEVSSGETLQQVTTNDLTTKINNIIQYSITNVSLSYNELDNDKKLQELVDNLVNETDDLGSEESRSRKLSNENTNNESDFSDSLQGSIDMSNEVNNNSIHLKKDLIDEMNSHQNSDDYKNKIFEDDIDLTRTQSDNESKIEMNSIQKDLIQDKIELFVNNEPFQISKIESSDENKIYTSMEFTIEELAIDDVINTSEPEENSVTIKELENNSELVQDDSIMTRSENDLQIPCINGTFHFGVGTFENSINYTENGFDEENQGSKNELSEDEKTELDEVRFDTQYRYFMQQLSKNESGHELDSINESDEYELDEIKTNVQELEAKNLKSNSIQIESDIFYSPTQSHDHFITGDELVTSKVSGDELVTSKISEKSIQIESDEQESEASNEETVTKKVYIEKNEATILEQDNSQMMVVIDKFLESKIIDDENQNYEDSEEYNIEEKNINEKVEQNNNQDLDSSNQGSLYYSVDLNESESNLKNQREIQNESNIHRIITSINESKESVEILNENLGKKRQEISIIRSLKLEESIKRSNSSNLTEIKQEDPERLITSSGRVEEPKNRKKAKKMSCFEKMINCCEIL